MQYDKYDGYNDYLPLDLISLADESGQINWLFDIGQFQYAVANLLDHGTVITVETNIIKEINAQFMQGRVAYYMSHTQTLYIAPRTLAMAHRNYPNLLLWPCLTAALTTLAHIGLIKDIKMQIVSQIGHLMILDFDRYSLMKE